MNKKLTDIGFISKAHGFQGAVVCAFRDELELPETVRFLFLILEGKPVPFYIEERKEKNSGTIIKFEDVNDEASAKKISGQRLLVETALLDSTVRTLNWTDLTGYAVTDKQYGFLGTLLSIEEYPEQMVARCMVNTKEVLFPLNEDFIVEINEDAKTLAIDLPEGLLDIYLDDSE